MILINWSHVEFSLNNAFWHRWGHDAAVPFRVSNIVDVQRSLSEASISSWLHGGTLRDAINGSLSPDHDDDIQVHCESVDSLKAIAEKYLCPKGFEVVRQSEKILSVLRYGRYVDLHPFPEEKPTTSFRVHGSSLVVPTDFNEYLRAKYGSAKQEEVEFSWKRWLRRLSTFAGSFSRFARKALRNPRRFFSSLLRFIAEQIDGGQSKKSLKKNAVTELTMQDFLSLKIDEEDSINWTWRGRHMRALYLQGETLGDALNRLKEDGGALADGVVETDLSKPLAEPMHLSYDFWNRGENYFVYPFLYGYRHLVLPYHSANLWIAWIGEPMLYSAEYFESLEPMNGSEIREFLTQHPIEVAGNSIVSGRHRASAMLGRLFRGEDYFPIFARQVEV